MKTLFLLIFISISYFAFSQEEVKKTCQIDISKYSGAQLDSLRNVIRLDVRKNLPVSCGMDNSNNSTMLDETKRKPIAQPESTETK